MTQTAFKRAGLVALCWALAGPAALALTEGDHPSPHNQIYQVQFGSAAPAFGDTIFFSFGDGLIDSYTESGIGGADQPGGTGSWYVDGSRITILGDDADPGYEGEELPPPPALQLLAEGQHQVECESWPDIEVGASAQPTDLCWITNPNVLSVTRTQ